MKVTNLVLALLLTIPSVGSEAKGAKGQAPAVPTVSQTLRSTIPQDGLDIRLKSLELPSIKERISETKVRRVDSFGNSRVDIAPKSWPYPMVVSPGRPVLPGSAW